MQFLSAGAGHQRYTLRFPIDLAHNAKINMPEKDSSADIALLGRAVSLHCAPFGVLAVARDFRTQEEALTFANRLRIAAQVMSIQRQIAVFTQHEPVPILESPGFIAGIGDDQRTIHGSAFQTMYTIIPEHELISSEGEIRGNMVRVLEIQSLIEAADALADLRESGDSRHANTIDTACNFWSLSCAQHSEIISIVNVVAALEVLSTTVQTKRKREFGVRELLLHYLPRLTGLSNCDSLSDKLDPVQFCRQLYRRRSELIHNGRSPSTSTSLGQSARGLCRRLLFFAIADHYLSHSPSSFSALISSP